MIEDMKTICLCLVFTAFIWGVAIGVAHVIEKPYAPKPIRERAIAINEFTVRAFKRDHLPAPLLLNVGNKPDDGTGDSMPVVMDKIAENMSRLDYAEQSIEDRR